MSTCRGCGEMQIDSNHMCEPVAGYTLLSCPFCGHQPDEENLIDSTHPLDREGTLWTTGCLDNEGGCNASMLAGSRQEAIDKWNTRVAHSAAPAPTILERAFDQMTTAPKNYDYEVDRTQIDSAAPAPDAATVIAQMEQRALRAEHSVTVCKATIDALASKIERAEAERDACHVELRAVDEALGTIDGHSAVQHILALKELLRECVEPLEAAKYRAECRLDRDNEPEPYFTLKELLARIDAFLKP